MESINNFSFKDIGSLRDKLLDMSLRNNLLNFKPKKKSIEIVDEDIVSLYNLIVLKETKMKFYSNENEPEYDKNNNTWDANAEIKESHLDKYLQTDYNQEELRKKLNYLYRENKTNLEEQGYNNLFLALGFLEWREDDNSEVVRSAPLILLPMTIVRKKVSSPYTVYWTGDEVRSNLSLIYKLKEQNIELEEFDEFESEQELINYLKGIEKAIETKKDWRITKDIYLSNFSFKKFVMFKDLDSRNWNDMGSSCASGLFEGNTGIEYSDYDTEYDFDSINSTEIYNVLDADSSQLAVLEDIKRGKNLVVEGPPGTGKSQTIVNIIAELMAMNKKILFVSEKKAALDVVKSRLDYLGLGEGCLELHGKNSNKKEVLKELQKTLNLEHVQLKDNNDFQELDELKKELNEYADTLHSIYGDTGLTAYALMGYYFKNKEILEENEQFIYDIHLNDVSSFNTEKRGAYVKKLDEIKTYYNLVNPVRENPWRETCPYNISTFDIEEIESDLNELINMFDDFEEITEKIHKPTETNKIDSLNIEETIYRLNTLNSNSKVIKLTDNLDELISNIEIFQRKTRDINLDVFNLDLNDFNSEINETLDKIEGLDIDFNIIDNEDLEYLKEELNITNQYIEDSNIKESLSDSQLEQKFNEIKSKTEFIENSNLKETLTDPQLEQKLNNFKSKTEFIENSNLKETLTDPQLEQKLNDFKDKKQFLINSNLVNLLNPILEQKLNEFKNNKQFIENSNLKETLTDPQLEQKLNEFNKYYNADIPGGKNINELNDLIKANNRYNSLKEEFISYYSTPVDDEQIISDLEELLKIEKEFDDIYDEFSKYYPDFVSDNRIMNDLEDLIETNNEYQILKNHFNSYYDNEIRNDKIIGDLEKLIRAHEELMVLKNDFAKYYVTDISNQQLIEDLEKLIITNKERESIKNKILNYCKNSNLKINELITELNMLSYYYNQLTAISLEFEKYDIHTSLKFIREKMVELIELNELLDKIIDNNNRGSYCPNTTWNSYDSDLNLLREELINLKKFNEYYSEGFFDDTTLNLLQTIDFDELNNNMSQLEQNKNQIISTYNKLNDKLHFNRKLNCFDETTDNNNANEPITSIPDYKSYLNSLLNNMDYLNDYRLFVKYCEEYKDKNTKTLIDYIQEDKINPELLLNLFYYNFSKTALREIFSKYDVLDDFNYSLHQEKIEKFKKLDKQIMNSNIIRVREILSNNRPNMSNTVSSNSSLGILKHEFTKKRRIKPIRKLLSRAHDAVSSIKPCFMMSPISIAQFLNPSTFESYFDYVIFDEASQVKIEDSIGAFLRAKKYVVMGDTKQLPPTTFFEKDNDIDEIDEDRYAADSESILHLCKNTTETRMLKWHYRSRHDSLITVSNNEFYDNKLYVFPSPMIYDEDLGLKFEYDPTTEYQRGSGKNNIKEAESLIEYAFNLIRKYGNTRSIGVATFNIPQRNTILDILENKLKEHPELEEYFDESGKEGFFVKNLENIQGDERDIILISMGYGKDPNGKLTMNFGPLNKDGGERRLNVLITRARMQCVVFSNFKSSEMNTTENTPRGVEALKNFLYYAELGYLPENYNASEDFDSPFEESVYNFLTDEGYQVENQVGCAGYKIDLAIIDKEDSNRYILAIECDGAQYHSSKSSRDRDRLRQSILEDLGWKFYRIWSTDWFHQTNSAKKRLINAIEDAIKQKDDENAARLFESNFEPEIIIKTSEDLINEELNDYFEDYEYCTNLYKYGDSYEAILKALIESESPIHIDDIYDTFKIIENQRLNKQLKRNIKRCLTHMDSVYNSEDFYYDTSFNYETLKVRKREKPNINRISDEELEKAIIYTLTTEFSSSRDGLIKSASLHLGFKSAGSKIKERFNYIIDYNLMDVKIRENNGLIELIK